MAWARVDDGFDDHPKILGLLEEEQGPAAIGLWTLCLTWAHRNTRRKGKTPGLIPVGLPRRYVGPAGRELAKLLVAHELWDEHDSGWMIHDFSEYLPTEETKAARSAAGKKGAAKRWAGKRASDARADEAEAKQTDGNLPSDSHDGASNDVATDGSRAPAHRAIPYGIAPTPTPEPGDEPSVHHDTSDGGAADDPDDDSDEDEEQDDQRDDVERVCRHLADRVQGNGSKRPRVSKTWRREARLLMDSDGRTEEQVHRAIDWCQDSKFWRRNVMSMPKLRAQYDRMRLEAEEQRDRASPDQRDPGPGRSTTDERVAQAQALKERRRARAEGANPDGTLIPPNTILGEVV
ncbi:hypothetical protein [Actinomadura rubrisoli]|uniref:DUF1376 domain-containing protein n=1 Tax=Actinomadura rubrisoli TaxID=2530368 RepID=A0A4R5CC82_9ACTN|nr:hypothetical protein [Actinomadura rubrisoli]TDD97588.1 hypothetical protein E1298_00735 [Actinomadura rubrisoli]